ncbi:bifunctional DNA primase/polymerase [Saccharothrix xinjiangensis]|uniref:Bifunctional DNA primase/polymerase n=1 Tax=Saccharothrix xinjiangensis TaxID=204798 RepID=A0ABV9Y4U5_9PSEU
MIKKQPAGAPHTVRLRSRRFGSAAKLAGFHSDYALAKAMGVNRSTVSRVMHGALQPGPAFIAGALVVLVPMQFDDLFEVVPVTAGSPSAPTPLADDAALRSTSNASGEMGAALEYAALGWPVLPGAVWRGSRFVDPGDGQPTTGAVLRPVEAATTDPGVIHQWWTAAGGQAPAVLTVTGANLGAVSVHQSLAKDITDHPRFSSKPTPVLALPRAPLAYFLIEPPFPLVLARRKVRALRGGSPLPLPPTVIGETAASWLVSPEETGHCLLPGGELANIINDLRRGST